MSADDIELFEKLLESGASKVELSNTCWIWGYNTDALNLEEPYMDYCEDCVVSEVERLNKLYPDQIEPFSAEGGYYLAGEADGYLPSCAKCHAELDTSLNNGDEYLDEFERNGFDLSNDMDCFILQKVIGCIGWDEYEESPRPSWAYRSPYEGDRERAEKNMLHAFCIGVLKAYRDRVTTQEQSALEEELF